MRMIKVFLALILLVQFLPLSSYAANTNVFEVDVIDQEENRLIDELFAERLRLEHDYINNQNEISRIDRQLVELGVEMLSSGDAQSLLCVEGVSPLWEPVSTDTIQWTSREFVSSYRGYLFDVQIIEGVPLSADSPLRENYVDVTYKAEGITAGIANAVIAAGSNLSIDFGNNILNMGVSFLNMLSDAHDALKESLSSSTVIDQVEGVAVLSFSGHMKYIYVKPYRSPDTERGLYYIGNSASCNISTLSIVDVMVDGELVTYHDICANVEDTVSSQYYDDYSKAIANYWDRNYNNMIFKQDYTVLYLRLNILGTTESYRLPWTTHPGMTT